MESNTNRGAANDQAPENAKPNALGKLLDPLDKPPRPLGAKRSALQAQRHRQSIAAWRKGLVGLDARPEGRVLTSSDGTLAFAIVPTATGLLVERRHCPTTGSRTAQLMSFDDADEFRRWCDSEPVRFSDPLLHDQLRRQGHEALCTRR